MADAQTPRPKTGGRTKGTPNKATAEVKAFLGRVFARAFTEKVTVTVGKGENAKEVEVGFEDALVRAIITLSIDTKLLNRLLEYHAGAPPKPVDHTHKGRIDLASIIAGTVDQAADEDDE